MPTWAIWLIAVGVWLLLTLGAIQLRRRIWRTERNASGWEDWRRASTSLPWRDRLLVAWSTLSGRAVSDRRLADAAAHRAEAGLALQRMADSRQARWCRWMRPPCVVLGLGLGAWCLFEQLWVSAAILLGNGLFWIFLPRLNRWERRRIERSAQANRSLGDAE
jgi:hypothetical protein